MLKKLSLMIPVISLLISGCDSGSSSSNSDNFPKSWYGESEHFIMVGSFDNRDCEVRITDFSQPIEGKLPVLGFKREYQYKEAGDGSVTDMRFVELEVGLNFVHDGKEKEIEVKLSHKDFDDISFDSIFNLVEGENEYDVGLGQEVIIAQGKKTALEVSMEYEDGDLDYEHDVLSASGTAKVELNSGTNAELKAGSGFTVLENGKIGVFINAVTNEGDKLVISFTANPLEDKPEKDLDNGVQRDKVDNFYE